MKILLKQFLGKNHSWAVCGWGITQGLLNQKHSVDLFSTDGIKNLPKTLGPNLIGYVEENKNEVYGKLPDTKYDAQISYTCMKNFENYLSHGNSCRIGIWCYEWAGKNVLPTGFAKCYKNCDFLCPPSQFAKQVFLDSGVPEQAMKVVPHGIIASQYQETSTVEKIKNNSKFKILVNVAQNHLRKNIPGLLEAYGKAFTKKDEVCLILKGKDKKPQFLFEVSIIDCLNDFYSKYPNHAEVILFSDFVEDISSLYRSVDAVYSLSHCEAFLFPTLEAIASGKMVIASNWGGQLDFLNDSNSLLVNGKEGRANPKSMYWETKNNAIWFEPNTDDAADKLRFAFKNYEKINLQVEQQRQNIYAKYDWAVIAQRYLDLCH